jgi:glutaredoxin
MMHIQTRNRIREALYGALWLAVACIVGLAAGAGWKSLSNPPVIEALDWPSTGLSRSAAIIMISAKSCPVCDRARRFLEEKGIAFVEMDVERSERARELSERLKIRTVPTFLMGDVRLNGFEPELLLKQLEPARNARE